MSTICKLNPTVRIARMRRATASLEVANLARRYGNAHGRKEYVALRALHVLLEDVRRDPRFTGPQKDAKFRSIMNRNR